MGVIAKNKKQITIYYNSEHSIGKQTYAYVKASNKKLHDVDISKTKVTATQWAELASNIGITIMELIDTNNSEFINNYGETKPEMEENDWLKIIENNPQLLKYSIVIDGENYMQIKSAAEFKKYLEPNSAGLEKQPLNKQFTNDDKA